MPASWTVTGASGAAMNATSRTLAEIGAESPKVVFRNLAADVFSWSVMLDGLAAGSEIIPDLGQVVSLFRDGTRFFRGNVTKVAQRGQRVDIAVSGPWWWLERIFLESTQTDATSATGSRATFVLPSQSLTTSLTSLLSAVATMGVEIGTGTLATTFSAPPIRLNQMSFAAALAEVVRVTPDMVLWFDYSGGGNPTANTSRRLSGLAAGSATTVTLDARTVEDFELNPLTELQVSQVKIPYLSRAANGAKKFEVQSAGTLALGKVQMLTVSGDEMDTFLPKDLLDSVSIQSTQWNTANLPMLDATIKAAIAQYGSYRSSPKNGVYSSLTVYTGSSNNKVPATYTFNGLSIAAKSGKAIPTATKYLVISTDPLPSWAQDQLSAIEVDITGTYVAVEPTNASGWSPLFAALRTGAQTGGPTWMNPDPTDNQQYYWFARELKVTGWLIPVSYASLTTYYKAADYGFAFPPAGFADGLLAAQNYIPHEGSVVIMEEDCGAARYLSKAINLSNSLTTHATMKAMVSEEELDLDGGSTTLTLGPPARFSYKDLVNRVRGSSNDNIVYL
jgi:hypothetical protein